MHTYTHTYICIQYPTGPPLIKVYICIQMCTLNSKQGIYSLSFHQSTAAEPLARARPNRPATDRSQESGPGVLRRRPRGRSDGGSRWSIPSNLITTNQCMSVCLFACLSGVSACSERCVRAPLRRRLAVSGVAAVHRGGRGRHDQRKREPGGVFDGSVSLSGAHGRVGRVDWVGLGWFVEASRYHAPPSWCW